MTIRQNKIKSHFNFQSKTWCAGNPNVVSVSLNKMHQLHTTRSWEFLGVERNEIIPKESIWEKARYGEDTIIGNLDTGI